MQTVLAILIVLAAVAYMAWQWMPGQWRTTWRMKDRTTTLAATASVGKVCGACSTCGACAKG